MQIKFFANKNVSNFTAMRSALFSTKSVFNALLSSFVLFFDGMDESAFMGTDPDDLFINGLKSFWVVAINGAKCVESTPMDGRKNIGWLAVGGGRDPWAAGPKRGTNETPINLIIIIIKMQWYDLSQNV